MAYEERKQRVSDDMSLLAEGEINPAQMVNRAVGEAGGLLGDAIDAVDAPVRALGRVTNPAAMLLGELSPIVQKGIQELWEGVKETGPAKVAAKWLKDNPEAAREISMGMNTASLLPVPGAALARKARTYAPEATKGGALASGDNYIPNWYAPKDSAPTALDKMAGPMLEKKFPEKVPEGAGVDAAKRGRSFVEWGQRGVGDMMGHTLDPRSKALYGEGGITSAQQKVAANHMMNQGTDTRALPKAVAEVLYGGNVAAQANRVGDVNPAAAGILDRAWMQGPKPNEKGNISEVLSTIPYKVDDANATRAGAVNYDSPVWKTAREETMSKKDAEFVEKHLNNIPGFKFDQFTVKVPSNIQTGGHWSDVVHHNNANPVLKKHFAKLMDENGNVDLQEFAKAIQNDKAHRVSKDNKFFKVLTTDPKQIEKDGLWLQGSKVGSAITEGGVGWMMKIEPDGNITAFMFDKHDFLEKAPVVGKMVEKALPNDLVAITPPMKANIKTLKSKQKGMNGVMAEQHFQQARKPQGEGSMEGLLDQFINAQPSRRNVAAEAMSTYGPLASLGLLGAQDENR